MDHSALFQKVVSFASAVHEVTHEMTRGIKDEDITYVQYKILEYMMFTQPVTPSEIADCVNQSLPNTSRELRKLLEKGLCEKDADETDRRRQMFRLSEAGQALISRIFAREQQRFEQRVQGLSAEETKKIEQALDLLRDTVFETPK
ncbi:MULTISPECIES: MarR family winged helix-turn-helix transcriptional regulator [Saccharibacillus]|uniref:MarR family winged helix-turn-helix transcriptional regulator n=1 Tax=Saccharibacillus TaxID=456492 RepID=UPI0012390AC2|nr:MarR family transcriptional regulator [Saccharibacillus sp. WB 17]MWJ32593.1 MarR family transcriptional regulator [Saccharibacillus sp. WB 17]